jgi:hypothetical protein
MKILQGILHKEDENKQNHERIGSIEPQEKKRQVSIDQKVALIRLHTITSLNNKMAGITTYLSILTLNVNGLNSLIKRHHLANWIKKEGPTIYC